MEEEKRKKKEEEEKLNKIKKTMVKLEPYLKELYGKILNNKHEKIYNIDILLPDEIDKKINELDKIILVNEENSDKIKKILCYKLVNQYINKSLNEKNILFDTRQVDFVKIYNILIQEEPILEKISLINSYNECQNNLNNKFFILNKERFKDIYPEAENIEIYYFKYNNKSYIYFKNDQIITEINKDDNYNKNGLCLLNKYEITELELLKYIKLEITKNKKALNIFNMKLNNEIKECYIINSNYLLSSLQFFENKYVYDNLEKIQPFNIINLNDNYPINFELLEKSKFEKVIDTLKTKNINFNNILVSNVLFVNEDNNKDGNQKKYFGIINTGRASVIINFYSFDNDEYSFEFLVNYNNCENFNNEILKILNKGIISYLSENNIYPNITQYKKDLIKEERLNLYNENKIVGFLKKGTQDKYDILPFSKGLEFEKSDNFNEILLCLINLEPFKEFFLKKEFKYDEHHIISNYFDKILNDLWNKNYDENKKIYIDFKEKIIQKQNLKSNKILIDFILKSLHNENVSLEFGGDFNSEDDLKNNCFTKSESIFQKNFFIKLYLEKFCPICKNKDYKYFYDCSLEIYPNIIENQKIITINDLLEFKMNEDVVCMNIYEEKKIKKECYNTFKAKKMFIERPNYLIIIINKNKNNNKKDNYKFKLDEIINLKEYKKGIKKEYNLELVSFICNKYVYCKNKNKNINCWIKYKGKDFALLDKETLNNNYISIPELLIYKKSK